MFDIEEYAKACLIGFLGGMPWPSNDVREEDLIEMERVARYCFEMAKVMKKMAKEYINDELR